MIRKTTYSFRDIDHFREQLRGWNTGAVQIEPGRINIKLNAVDLNGLMFYEVGVDRKVIDISRIEHGWIKFVINLSPATFCGIEVSPFHMTVLAQENEYQSVLASWWHDFEIVAQLSVLADEGLRIAPHLVLGPETASIRLPRELVGVFQRLARIAFRGDGSGQMDDAWLRGAVLRALGQALDLGNRRSDAPDPHSRAGYDLTSRMIHIVESRFGHRVTVNEIAGELGVTSRALHYAVRSATGMSPLELILAFRLNHVREELWDARANGASVTAAAMTQDFGHLGRFSQHYRTLFGESPSETVNRIRVLASD